MKRKHKVISTPDQNMEEFLMLKKSTYDALKLKEQKLKDFIKTNPLLLDEHLKLLVDFISEIVHNSKIPKHYFNELDECMTKCGYSIKYMGTDGRNGSIGKGDKEVELNYFHSKN